MDGLHREEECGIRFCGSLIGWYAGKNFTGFRGFFIGRRLCDWGFVVFGFHVVDCHLILTLGMDGRYLLIITSHDRGERCGGGVRQGGHGRGDIL